MSLHRNKHISINFQDKKQITNQLIIHYQMQLIQIL